MRLDGKTAIVTGAAHGIGRSIAEGFAEEGAVVYLADIDQTTGAEAAVEIVKQGGRAEFCLCDVSSNESVSALVERAGGHNGRIDILCNNAAYLGQFHAAHEATTEEWERCWRVQVLGAQHCAQAVLPYMIRQTAGSIVNVVSIQAMVGCPTSVAYTAAKAALLGFTLSLAYDYGPQNIRVNSLSPGPIQTRISPKPGEPHYQWQCEQTLLKRTGEAREVARAAVFLASDDGSYITGVNLPVDGGWTAH